MAEMICERVRTEPGMKIVRQLWMTRVVNQPTRTMSRD